MSDSAARLAKGIALALVAWGVAVLFVGSPFRARRAKAEETRRSLLPDIQRYLSAGGEAFPEYESRLGAHIGKLREDRQALERRLGLKLDARYTPAAAAEQTILSQTLITRRLELQEVIQRDAQDPAEQTSQDPIDVVRILGERGGVKNAFGIPDTPPGSRDEAAKRLKQLGVAARIWDKILVVNDPGRRQRIYAVDELQVLDPKPFPEGGGTKYPVRVAFQASLRALMAFLEAMDEEGKSLSLEQISVRPPEDRRQPLVVKLEVSGILFEGGKAAKAAPRFSEPPGY